MSWAPGPSRRPRRAGYQAGPPSIGSPGSPDPAQRPGSLRRGCTRAVFAGADPRAGVGPVVGGEQACELGARSIASAAARRSSGRAAVHRNHWFSRPCWACRCAVTSQQLSLSAVARTTPIDAHPRHELLDRTGAGPPSDREPREPSFLIGVENWTRPSQRCSPTCCCGRRGRTSTSASLKQADHHWTEIKRGTYRIVGLPDRDFPKLPDHSETSYSRRRLPGPRRWACRRRRRRDRGSQRQGAGSDGEYAECSREAAEARPHGPPTRCAALRWRPRRA